MTTLPRGASVSIVVPYYRDQVGLDRLFLALGLQHLPDGMIEHIEVVVADDGSPEPPRIDRSPFPCRVVRQSDAGFRAAAARNLGARSSTGGVLVFCDGDMAPEPGWLTAMCDLGADQMTVGRRRHASFEGCSDEDIAAFLSGSSARGRPVELAEPEWLSEGYRRTRDLTDVHPENWRFVISAAMSMSRRLFDELGGFDELFDRYGGEDWDLAYRALNCGVALRHRRDAVAWHDGADWAGRGGGASTKLHESNMLALRIPRPSTRPPGWWDAPDEGGAASIPGGPVPAIVVSLPPGADVDDPVWAAPLAALRVEPDPYGSEVRVGEWRDCQRSHWCQRVRLHVELRRPIVLGAGAGRRLLGMTEPGRAGRVVLGSPSPALVATATWWRRRRLRCSDGDRGAERSWRHGAAVPGDG